MSETGIDFGLEGRVAWVTGASGGIGWAVAKALHRAGCRLLLHANSNADSLERRAAEAFGPQGVGDEPPRWQVEAGDVGDPTTAPRIVDRGVERFGGLDVCVFSAGIWPEESLPLHRLPEDRIRQVLETNLLGTLFCARSFLGQLERTGRTGSSAIFIGSTAGRFGEAGHAAYAVSKAGLRGLMLTYKNEVVELDPQGRCNLVEPGWTATPMASGALADDKLVRRSIQTMALRRVATAEDVAGAVLFFASPGLSAHLSGETLTVAGGMEGRLLWPPEKIDPSSVRDLAQKECRTQGFLADPKESSP